MAHRITLEHSMGSLTPLSLWPLNPSPLLRYGHPVVCVLR